MNTASALEPSGTTVAVIQATTATGPGGSRNLETQRPVYSGDRINTGNVGEAQIRFLDETRLVVGPNSSLVIDKFVFSPNQSAVDVSVRAVRGALRFISGSGPSQAYTIRTPTATLGIRGTQFDVAIGRNGETGLIVLSGAVRMCGRTGNCIVVDKACGAAIALPNGRVREISSLTEKATRINEQFPYIVSQASLRRDFRVNTRSCAGITAAATATGTALGFFSAFSSPAAPGHDGPGIGPTGGPGIGPTGGPGIGPTGGPGGGPTGGPGNGNGNAGNPGNGGGNTGGFGPGTGNGGSNNGQGIGASNGGGGFGNGGFGAGSASASASAGSAGGSGGIGGGGGNH